MRLLFLMGVSVLACCPGASAAVPAPSAELLPVDPIGPSVALTEFTTEAVQPVSLCDCCACGPSAYWYDELTLFAGIDGSKQPQDFGVNANLGAQLQFNLGLPVSREYGIGAQIGSSLIPSTNAVQVYDLVGETTDRLQSYTTVGLYQRTPSGFAWGFVYDFLYEDSYDQFSLGQWRVRGAFDVGPRSEVGLTAHLSGQDASGEFNAAGLGGPKPLTLRPIAQGSLYWRRFWETGTQTTLWFGLAEGHGENNAVTGPAADKDESFVMGADILAPLNDYLAIYGETNLIMPPDTGTVDAFLGVQFFPGGGAKRARRTPFAPLLPVAAPTSFSVDLVQ
ncbi:hypothetical protein Pla175_18250 [Pirellulimonas nuda]|uniref:Transporter n=1 Tax=Pirellulimonas nuda TaxID=2528009 RepID=A0A518DAC9_9BACT|nr:DUF6666 family protein [Pirellulimonas nuda]QDU88447.1 hypothetical protein Pla175_18250 [Pirellulimonas nuda]